MKGDPRWKTRTVRPLPTMARAGETDHPANAAGFADACGDATTMQPLEMWDVCNPLDDQCGTDLTCQEGGGGIYECMLRDAMDGSGGR
eukprot:COSAG06_NODE_8327_length_2202_cov_4.748370_1_plen_88_part_00